MDPNTTLAAIRELIREIDDADDPRAHLDALASNVEALDEWLTKGGFLPDAWGASPMHQPKPARDVQPGDTVVREAGVKVVTAITEKIEARAHTALYDVSPDDQESDVHARRVNALRYATSALRGINTALSLGRGGFVSHDDPTGLFFHGILTGAVIDRDNEFTAHT